MSADEEFTGLADMHSRRKQRAVPPPRQPKKQVEPPPPPVPRESPAPIEGSAPEDVSTVAPEATSEATAARRGRSKTMKDEGNACITVRLRQPVANALRAAWLEEKRSNVLLAYSEFASEVVMAGLAAQKRRK